MKKTEIFTLGTPYREDLKITGYTFGQGQKSACIVGSIRGNEVQQLYVCSQIVRKLEELEAQYVSRFGPLTSGDVSGNNGWTWGITPMPWEGGN